MIDLHTHSTASDGSLSPQALVSLAQRLGITTLALTDHNTVSGLPAFLTAADLAGIQGIAGVEISCALKEDEVHILALDLPRTAFSRVQEWMTQTLRWGEESKRDLVERLRRAGYRLTYEEIQASNPDSVINRAHVGMALVEKGYAATVQEAFDTLLCKDGGFYRPPRRLDACQVISVIRDLGAVSVWAHPFLRYDEAQVRASLEILCTAGLEAMEVYYPSYSPAQTAAALALAEEFHLKVSGGSDFHGDPKPDIQLGTGRGNLNIPQSIAQNLLRRQHNDRI